MTMRNLLKSEINRYRITDERVLVCYGWAGDETCGMFEIPSPKDGAAMRAIHHPIHATPILPISVDGAAAP